MFWTGTYLPFTMLDFRTNCCDRNMRGGEGLPHLSSVLWTAKIKKELGGLNWILGRYCYCLDYKANMIYDFELRTNKFKNHWEGRKIKGGHLITEGWGEYFDVKVYVYGWCGKRLGFCNLYCLPVIMGDKIKNDKMGGAWKGDMHTVFYSEYLKRRNQRENMKADTRIILKLIVKYEGICCMFSSG